MDFIILVLIILTLKLYIRHHIPDTYNAYIHSPQWRRTRQKILKRDLYQCTECHSKKSLQVHHLTYKHLGHERPEELTTLCSSCHKNRHARKYISKHIL